MNYNRRDHKNRRLKEGESQRADKRYRFTYVDLDGNKRDVYSWRLDKNDPHPEGKRKDLSLREKEKQIETTINTVYFWSDTVKGLSEIKRCLKEGCSFYNVVFTKEYLDTIKYTEIGYKKFEPEELVQYGRDAGFENIQIKEIVKGKSFVVIYTK